MAELEYSLYGLRIRSTLELAQLQRRGRTGGPADVEIRTGIVPERLAGVRFESPLYDIDTGVLLLRIPGVARYLVTDGRQITVQPAPEADVRSLELFLLGSAFGALCQQRGLLPLHASAVDVGGACVAFTGVSGAGKSTMAVCLAERGYPLVCDDVCVIGVDDAGEVLVSAADARVKLWEDGLHSLNVGLDGLRSVRAEMRKFHLPVRGVQGTRPVPLAAVYVLTEQGDRQCIEPLHGFDAIMAIAENTYRREFIQPLGLARQHFAWCGAVARRAHVRRLTRPRRFDAMDVLVADLVTDWQTFGDRITSAQPMHASRSDDGHSDPD